MGRSAVAFGAVLIVAGGAALGYAFTRKSAGGMTPAASAAIEGAATQLDGDISAKRALVKQRAETLSTYVQIRYAIGTDATTAKDQVAKGDVKVTPEAGEVIELVQVPLANGAPQLLVALPETGMRSSRGGATPGGYAELQNGQIIVGHTTEIEPIEEKKDKFKGFITSSRTVDVAASLGKLAAAGLSGKLALDGKEASVGTMAAGAKTSERTLAAEPRAKLVIAVPGAVAAVPMPVVAVGAAAAGLGLIVLLFGLLARKQAPAQPGIQNLPTLPTSPPIDPQGVTKLSSGGVGAAGTPSPVDGTGPAINPNMIGPGTLIGRWEVVRRLGSGGMADVYLAHARGEAGFEKLVAIKVMHGHLARNERAVAHFLDEARLAARIVHPNVVAIQDLGKIGNDYVIVMDYVEGVDLERLLASARTANRPVPIDVGLGIICRICDGLNAAHTALGPDGSPLNVIHRDVKSANVLVSRQGGVKVVDFGIAKAANQVHMTYAGETKGTPSMMAPEQRVGEQVDVRADVYSVGAVAYETLTGHAVNLDLAALAHLGVENWPHLPPPSQLRPQLPPELDAILLTAMAFDRERRPANCAVFEEILERVMKSRGLSCSDKDIARWVDSELRLLVPPFQGASTLTRPTTPTT